MLTSGVVRVHDNAGPCTAAHILAMLEYSSWELFDHPLNIPDLASSDCHLFTYPKNWLGSQHYNNIEEFMEGVETCLSSQAADIFDRGIQKRILLYDKCLNKECKVFSMLN
jgi:hypothetical protein